MTVSSPLPNPNTICGYRIVRELSPGKSWLAEDPMATDGSGKLVLKRVPADCLFKGQLRDSVKDRLNRVREIAHMGVASLLGVEKEGEAAYLIWRYVEGEPFQSNSEMNRKLIRSVEAFHGLGLVHGALHAGNVIVRHGELYLIDVSPLLFTDPKVDIAAVAKLIGKPEPQSGVTLRELESADSPSATDEADTKETSIRVGALIGAAVVALLGVGIAYLIWHYA